MIRYALVFVGAVVGCGPTRAPELTAPPSKRAISPCGEPGAARRARPSDQAAFSVAHARARTRSSWGGGPAAIEPPQGFVRLAPPQPATDSSEGTVTFARDFRAEDFQDHVASFSLDGDGARATVRIYRRPAPAERAADLFRYLAGAYDEEPDAAVPTEAIKHWYNYTDEDRDRRGRRVVEWGLVPKGCERAELYEHFVEDDPVIWHVVLEVEGTVPATLLADWLARFFDAPFDGPLPRGRTSLAGRGTPR